MRRTRASSTARARQVLLALVIAASVIWPAGRSLAADDGGFIAAFKIGGDASGEVATVNKVVLDADGNVYVVADFRGTVDADPGAGAANVTALGGDTLIAKYSPSGALLWHGQLATQAGGGLVFARDLARDAAGNLYVAGVFQGNVDFDPGPLAAPASSDQTAAFVLKLAPGGALQWFRVYDSPGMEGMRTLALDAAGNVYLAGDLTGTVDFDAAPRTDDVISPDPGASLYGFVLKLTTHGAFTWVLGPFPTVNGVTVTPAGMYAAGYFNGTVDFEPSDGQDAADTLASGGTTHTFVLALGHDGGFRWVRQVEGPDRGEGLAIAADAAGNVYAAGFFEGVADFAPGPATSIENAPGGSDDVQGYVWKLDGAGGFVWARTFGGPGDDDRARAIAVDAAGQVHVAGTFGLTGDFDPGPDTAQLTSAGDDDIFLVKLDAAGALVWARRSGGAGQDRPTSLALDGAGNLVHVGEFFADADFDPGPGTATLTTTAGLRSGHLVRLDATPTNEPPVNSLPGPRTVAEDAPMALAGPSRISVADPDAGADPIRVGLAATNGTLALNGTVGLTVVGGANGSAAVTVEGPLPAINAALDGLVFQPTPNFVGAASLQIVTDDLGNTGEGGARADADTLAISVTSLNDAPTARADAYATTAGIELLVPAPGVLANDADPDAGTTLQAQPVAGPRNGSLTLNPDGSLVYTPTPGFTGSDTFTYRAWDGSAASQPATVAVTVAPTACVPRPRIKTEPVAGGGRLAVTIEATPLNTPANNPIHWIAFGRLDNARVRMNGQLVASNQTVPVPANTVAVGLTVERIVPGQPATAHFTVVDGCGEWETFVGGGTAAGF